MNKAIGIQAGLNYLPGRETGELWERGYQCLWIRPELGKWAVGRSQAHQTHILKITGLANMKVLLVTGEAGSRTEG